MHETKMRKIVLTLLALAAMVTLATGCLKGDTDGHTDYIIKPLVQTTSGGLNELLPDIIGYAFDADTLEWTVASYEDALNGVLTHKEQPSEQLAVPIATAAPYTVEGMTDRYLMRLPDHPVMLLVVDHTNRLYAYTNQKLEPNMGSLFVTLIFKPWKEGAAYQEGWSFYNPFYEPQRSLETYTSVTAQTTDGGAEDEVIDHVKLYAFAADTTAWRIASYDDAVAGIITSKSDPEQQRTTPEYTAYQTNDERIYRMTVNQPTLMVVAVDRTHRMYAYSKQVVDLTGESPTFSVLFRPWQPLWITEEGAWRIVNPEYEPEQNENQPTQQ